MVAANIDLETGSVYIGGVGSKGVSHVGDGLILTGIPHHRIGGIDLEGTQHGKDIGLIGRELNITHNVILGKLEIPNDVGNKNIPLIINCSNNTQTTITDLEAPNSVLEITGDNSGKVTVAGLELLPGDLLSMSNSQVTFAKLSINDDTKEKIWDFIQEVDPDNNILILDITNSTQDGSLIFLQSCKAVSKNICFVDDSYSNNELLHILKMSSFTKSFFIETHKIEDFQSQTHSINWKEIFSNLSTLEGDALENSIKELDENIARSFANEEVTSAHLEAEGELYSALTQVPGSVSEDDPLGIHTILGDNPPLPEDLS